MANRSVSALELVAATANTSGADQDNRDGSAAVVVIDITAITGTTPTATFTVEGKDVVTGKYYTILASTALNAIGTTVLRIGRGLTAAANLVAVDLLPTKFRVRMTIGGTAGPTVTAKVGVSMLG